MSTHDEEQRDLDALDLQIDEMKALRAKEQDRMIRKIPAFRTEGGDQLVIWCQHEQTWHYHGVGNGSRSSHCACPKSDLAGQYELVEVGRWTERVKRAHPAELPSGRSCMSARGECRFDRTEYGVPLTDPRVDLGFVGFITSRDTHLSEDLAYEGVWFTGRPTYAKVAAMAAVYTADERYQDLMLGEFLAYQQAMGEEA